jgi:membrane protease YdiL (CAAX protease family)
VTASEFDPSSPQRPAPPGIGSAPPEPIDLVEFIETPPAVPADTSAAPAPPVAVAPAGPPGPGLPEAVGWTALVLAGQIGAMTVLMVVVVAVLAIQNAGRLPANAFDLKAMEPNAFALVSGLPGLLAYLVLIPLACWRMSPQPFRKLNFSKPSLTQALIVCSCVLPLGYVSDVLYTLMKKLWDVFLEQFPMFQGLREIGLDSTMTQLNGASLPLLLFLLAVVPAVGEEWMLRGLIGRGLVARWGVPVGVFFTSVLFAVMHLDPPHVGAVFPIGIMMHIVYLATRSFWMPIAYHFLNNATVSLFTSLGAGEVGESSEESSRIPHLLAVPYLVLAVAALWKVRTKYLAADGREPDRGYFSFEHYPESVSRRVAPNHVVLGAVFGTLLIAQISSVGVEAWQLKYGQPEDQAGEVVVPANLDDVEAAPAD